MSALSASPFSLRTVADLSVSHRFGLEAQTKKQIQELRSTELHYNRRRKLLGLAFSITNYTLPLLVMVVTFAVFTLVQGGQLVRLLFSSSSRSAGVES